MLDVLRTCSAGLGQWAGHDSRSFDGNYYCPRHLWSLLHNFNPQPYGKGGTDTTVKFIDGGRSGGFDPIGCSTPYVVLDRIGDLLTLRPLGFPDVPTVTALVDEVYPAQPGAVYRYANHCGSAPHQVRAHEGIKR